MSNRHDLSSFIRSIADSKRDEEEIVRLLREVAA
jgi:hypothetical protein